MTKREKRRLSARDWLRLTGAARQARGRAYAPYSRYRVGAALLTTGGKIVTGCNVENASYGLTICAERTAVTAAVAGGARRFRALVIASSSGVGPCGACRQVLAEFAPKMPVRIVQPRGNRFSEATVEDLLPGRFSKSSLKR